MQKFRAPARIPLYLRVVGVNEDGSPEMIALNQTIDLCDHLMIESAQCDQLPSGHHEIQKSIIAFREHTGKSFPVSITLHKHLPEHVDLGLKFSHAATTLWALNQISPNPLKEEELRAIAQRVHSDVFFFFTQGTAKCFSKGDVQIEQAPLDCPLFCLVFPPYSLPSDKIYNRLSMVDLQDRTLENSLESLIQKRAQYCNDLEEPAFALNPKLALRKLKMKELGFQTVVMAGTGPALYCMDGPLNQLSQEEGYQTQYISRTEGNWY